MKKPPPGEFELIAQLARHFPSPRGEVVVGIGDDAAAIACDDGLMLLTCDIAVAGRHFVPGLTPMADVGWRVATSNVSDIAACGGLPTCALVSLGVPGGATETDFDDLYDGIAEAGAHYGFQVLGGNVSGAEQLVVDCFMIGKAPRFIARAGARPGDLVAVSGALGGSEAGLAVLKAGAKTPAEEALLRRHLHPVARTDLVGLLQEVASAAIDISDSLASELHHLAEAGGVAMAVEQVPVSQELAEFSRQRGEDPLQHALFGGEEYELLFTLAPADGPRLEGTGAVVIGSVAAGSGVTLSGKPLPAKGWDHLKPRD